MLHKNNCDLYFIQSVKKIRPNPTFFTIYSDTLSPYQITTYFFTSPTAPNPWIIWKNHVQTNFQDISKYKDGYNIDSIRYGTSIILWTKTISVFSLRIVILARRIDLIHRYIFNSKFQVVDKKENVKEMNNFKYIFR